MPIIPVAEWAPDLAADSGAAVAENAIADVDSYLPWPSVQTYSNSISERAQGAIAAIGNDRLAYNYAGGNQRLYRLLDQSWTVADNTVSASYSTSLDQWWEFVQWGNTVIGTNGVAAMQEITLGSTNFTSLTGAPPIAKHLDVVRDFVMAGNIFGNPQRVQWCAQNNSHSWTIDATTQADYQDLPGGGGHVQRVIGGNIATIFQERAIWRARYVGSPAIFDFGDGPIVRDIGTIAPQSVVAYGPAIAFLSEDGFKILSPSGIDMIGRNKIDRYFFADLDSQYTHRIQAVVWPTKGVYMCAYPGAGNTSGNPNKILVYNYNAQKWTVVDEETEMLFKLIATGYTLETLDTVSSNIDLLPESLDSSLWAGGQINMAAFNTSHMSVVFSGTARQATVETNEIEIIPGRRAKVFRVRPVVQGACAVAALTRNALESSKTVGSSNSQNSTGDVPMRTNARWHSFRVTTTNEFDHIRGVDIQEVEDGGSR